MSNPLKVLIIGAGELGISMLAGYAAHPVKTKLYVLLRPDTHNPPSPSRQAVVDAINQYGASPIYLDLTASSSDLVKVLIGFDIVVSCAGMSALAGTEEKLCQAAIQAKVGRYIPWQFGVDYDQYDDEPIVKVFKESQSVRSLLRSQRDISWTIVSTGIFISFIFEPVVGIFEPGEKGGTAVVRGLGSWEQMITITSVEDIGKLTAGITLGVEKVGIDGVVFVVGDTVTYGQIADAVECAGWQVERKLWTETELERQMKENDGSIARYRIMCARGVGMSWNKANSWNERTGVKTENLVEWIRRRLPRSSGV
jgi:hypothetical protein